MTEQELKDQKLKVRIILIIASVIIGLLVALIIYLAASRPKPIIVDHPDPTQSEPYLRLQYEQDSLKYYIAELHRDLDIKKLEIDSLNNEFKIINGTNSKRRDYYEKIRFLIAGFDSTDVVRYFSDRPH